MENSENIFAPRIGRKQSSCAYANGWSARPAGTGRDMPCTMWQLTRREALPRHQGVSIQTSAQGFFLGESKL